MTTTGGAPVTRPSSIAKREAVLAVAEEAFLGAGYDAVTMDDLAERSGVAKQTVYAHFGSKEELFVQLVTAMTAQATERVHTEPLTAERAEDLAPALEQYLRRQLDVVLMPRLLQLRRLVIGEVHRFPDLARALAQHGPQRAVEAIAVQLAELDRRGLLVVPEPRDAASQLNWLVMGEPVNIAMLRGDDAVPSPAARTAHVRRAVATFLAAYGGARNE